jgi:rare lipoprotein A
MEVIIQDRGPFARNRIIDVSPLAAESLGFKDEGVAAVALEIVSDPDNRSEADLTK